MKVVIANYSRPVASDVDFKSFWASHTRPERGERVSLLEYKANWGFHIFSIGVYLLDLGLADEVEFWHCGPQRKLRYHPQGVLKVTFHDEQDMLAYLERYGDPDLYIQHGGSGGRAILEYLEGRCFRVYVPALRQGIDRKGNFNAECHLVDSPEFLDERSMLYVPVVNTEKIRPAHGPRLRDFIYLSEVRHNKRHDILLNAVRGTALIGHLHPVRNGELDLSGTHITTTGWDEAEVVELLQTSRMAVYPGDHTSSPAAMWECVAAGLPIVVNKEIAGGAHLVVPGVTGEFASERGFYEVMQDVLGNLHHYSPREYFLKTWDTVAMLEAYLAFFRRMGWEG